jgi:hypothetical protein
MRKLERVQINDALGSERPRRGSWRGRIGRALVVCSALGWLLRAILRQADALRGGLGACAPRRVGAFHPGPLAMPVVASLACVPFKREGEVMNRAHRFVGIVSLVLLCAASGVAAAHSTGHESRTVAECERLPGTQMAGERGQCLRCVERPRPHHYHPDMVRGDRCHLNDGLPR